MAAEKSGATNSVKLKLAKWKEQPNKQNKQTNNTTEKSCQGIYAHIQTKHNNSSNQNNNQKLQQQQITKTLMLS